jgi:hypothetical protein
MDIARGTGILPVILFSRGPAASFILLLLFP